METGKDENKQFEFGNRRLSASDGLWFGAKPLNNFERKCNFFTLVSQAGVLALIAGAIAFGITHIFNKNYDFDYLIARYVAAAIFLLRIFLPYVQLVWSGIRHREIPNFYGWKKFTLAEKSTANLGIAILIIFAINDLYGFVVKQGYMEPIPFISNTLKKTIHTPPKIEHRVHNRRHPLTAEELMGTYKTIKITTLNNTAGLILIIALWFFLLVMTTVLEERSPEESNLKGNQKLGEKGQLSQKKKALIENLPFGLWLGESTGRLSELSHGVGIARKQQVALFHDDAA
jgi:hypothetical protein